MSPPLVSIVTPTYDMSEFIPTTLHSVAAQEYPHIEYLVVDGGNDAETPEIVAGMGDRIDRYVREPDRGQSDAINKGFRAARGEILAWLNADDYYFPDAVARAARAFEQDPELDIYYGDAVFVDARTQFLRYFTEVESYDPNRLRNVADYICQPTTFFRRETLERVGALDESLHYAMDWDLWCRMAVEGCKFRYEPALIAASRLHVETKTSTGGLARLREIWHINRRYKTSWLPWAFINYSRWEVPGHFFSAALPIRVANRLVTTLSAAKRTLMSRGGPPPKHGIFWDGLCGPEAQVRLPQPLAFPSWLELWLRRPVGLLDQEVAVSVQGREVGRLQLRGENTRARFRLTCGTEPAITIGLRGLRARRWQGRDVAFELGGVRLDYS